MSVHLTSGIILLVIFALFGAAISTWHLRLQKKAENLPERPSLSPSEGRWLATPDQIHKKLVREERHILDTTSASDKDESYAILREERYRSTTTGAVVASIPPKAIADCDSEEHGHELIEFFEEVSEGGRV